MNRSNTWISLAEKMPPEGIAVVFTDGDAIVTGAFTESDHQYSDDVNLRLDRPAISRRWITHWMLPVLPK